MDIILCDNCYYEMPVGSLNLQNSDVQWTTFLLDKTCAVYDPTGYNFSTFFNMVSKSLILTAIHWTKTRGLRLTSKWNSGERCAACRHMKRSEWRANTSCQIKYYYLTMYFKTGRANTRGWLLYCRRITVVLSKTWQCEYTPTRRTLSERRPMSIHSLSVQQIVVNCCEGHAKFPDIIALGALHDTKH